MTHGLKTSLPMHVDFLPDEAVNLEGVIGMCSAPGMKDPNATDANRDLDTDLKRLRNRYQVDVLVTLLERGQYVSDELAELGIPELLVCAQRIGIETDWTPLPDRNVPVSVDQLTKLVERILMAVRQGKAVVIHGREGYGRTGLVAACCLAALGAAVDEALGTVRATRPGAVQTQAQLQTLRAFDQLWRRRTLERATSMGVSDLFEASASISATTGSSARSARISAPGVAPLSQAGAATIGYLGIDPKAEAAGVPGSSPLRRGDSFHLLPGQTLWLGRGGDCEVTIGSAQLSRLHAMLAFVPVAEGRLVLTDCNSRNGTWVDDEEITVCYLETGDEFALAKAYRFRFESIG